MFTLVEALNYRCLRYVRQPLGSFHVLVGANATGKTTFLDAVAFLGDLVKSGPEAAVRLRTHSFEDLVWARRGKSFQLAVEARVPASLETDGFGHVRYEVEIGLVSESEGIGILSETVRLKSSEPDKEPSKQRSLFPEPAEPPPTILEPGQKRGTQAVLRKNPEGNDNFYTEVRGKSGKGWIPTFKLGPKRSALANLPEDESKFPVATWLKSLLSDGVDQIVLDSIAMRKASPPGQSRAFKTDGSNLPWVVDHLFTRSPQRFQDWIAHVKTSLVDLERIETIERPDDRHRYLKLVYRGGLEVPSWTASDGTLRLLALTLLGYLPDLQGVYLIEEPENGIHPRAVETMFQSLSNVYEAQVLLATHSTVLLSLVDPKQLLCFAKTDEGATDIVLGSEHPYLVDWKGETSLATLFAAGVLG